MLKHCSIAATIIACLVFSTGAFAADWATSAGSCYAAGDKYLDVGIPIPMYPAGVHAAFDYAFHDAISGGGGIGFRYYYGWSSWYYNSFYLTFLGRAAFHPFNLKVLEDKIKVRDKLDVYVGPCFWVAPSLNGYVPDWGVREFIGLRWHFSPKFCLFVEDCGGFGFLDGGITFKF
ncbi:MAG TPA: hypothetical protein VLX68_11650 [Chitinivibrionales bacterium]|nr:hypothetical protein [Chitinivibrionales bacterium]